MFITKSINGFADYPGIPITGLHEPMRSPGIPSLSLTLPNMWDTYLIQLFKHSYMSFFDITWNGRMLPFFACLEKFKLLSP